jgi:hypothetical protein
VRHVSSYHQNKKQKKSKRPMPVKQDAAYTENIRLDFLRLDLDTLPIAVAKKPDEQSSKRVEAML